MLLVGIDVAKDKHDCFITEAGKESEGICIVIPNNKQGFELLYSRITAAEPDLSKIKAGLEATGHYSNNILRFLQNKGLTTYVINPLHTNLFRKSLSLRKLKTDKVDARTIAAMMSAGANIESYSAASYHTNELKSLTRYRFNKVKECSALKQSVSRLVNIMFPELESCFPTLHSSTVYALLTEAPGAKHVADMHLTHLRNLLNKKSRGRYGRDKAIEVRAAARESIGTSDWGRSMELTHTIRLINELGREIKEIDAAIKKIMDEMNAPILSIPGISYALGSMILAETGDISKFETPDQVLAYAGVSPSRHESGQVRNSHPHMEKRGSRYLRYALYTAAVKVCKYNPVYAEYLKKKLSEGKHFYVAISHVMKKLVRLIFALQTTGKSFQPAG